MAVATIIEEKDLASPTDERERPRRRRLWKGHKEIGSDDVLLIRQLSNEELAPAAPATRLGHF